MIPTDTATPEQRAKYEAHVKKRTPHAGTTATYVRNNLPESPPPSPVNPR